MKFTRKIAGTDSNISGNAVILASAMLALLFLINIATAPSGPGWWDTSWHYRVTLQINNSNYERYNWPIEQEINFTGILRQGGASGTFDINSMRVVEHNATGGIVTEKVSQFDAAPGFNATTNAAGTIVFALNGTMDANETRYIYIYFDILENGAKSAPNYTTRLNYTWDGNETLVNNTIMSWRMSTVGKDNTSGIYEVRDYATTTNVVFKTDITTTPTKEYVQYSNATNSLAFDFSNNATFRQGPLRIILEQAGDEALWNDTGAKTNTGRMVKRYVFYENSSWIRVEENFTNTGGSDIIRNSTALASALALTTVTTDFGGSRAYFGNTTNPGSWALVTAGGAKGVGFINLNQTGTQNYFATNDSNLRVGISLNETTIPAGGSITEAAVMQFNGTSYNKDVHLLPLRDALLNPPQIIVSPLEAIGYGFLAGANHTAYNRNESVLIFGNTTSDPNNIVSSMNATIDMGTASLSDDITLGLYDDGDAVHGDSIAGDKIFSNVFNLSEASATGTWNVTMGAYDSAGVRLNQSSAIFDVTSAYNETLQIENPAGFVSRLINATLTLWNFRQDALIAGATVNCSYNSTPETAVSSITDYGNGTYFINFTAPSLTGNYILNCTASKFNNTGNDSRVFWTETSKTEMLLNLSPESRTSTNISAYSGDAFNITANATDIGGATARYVAINLMLPANFSVSPASEACGNVTASAPCIKAFNITVANKTAPGNYTLNFSAIWENPDGTQNYTNASFAVYVLQNPLMDVPESNISGTVGDGNSAVLGNFTVRSYGNANATNITFSVSGLPGFAVALIPQNISWLSPESDNSVSVNASAPAGTAPGNYSGTINVSVGNGGWDTLVLNVSVPAATNMSMGLLPENHTSANISVQTSDIFNITVNATDTGSANARYVNITLSVPQNIGASSTLEQCGNVSMSSSCVKAFNITVANKTAPGNYTLNFSAIWENPDGTVNYLNRSFVIYVLPNPRIDVVESNVSGTVADGESTLIGNFTVRSFGNSNITNITFNISGLSGFTIVLTPENISGMEPESNASVSVNVSAPPFTSAGNYSGAINISAGNGGWDTVALNVSVPARREWSASPTFCEKAESPPEGTVCPITVSNSGNDILNFTVSPAGMNHTSSNETSFYVLKNSTHVFAMLYNVSNITKEDFTALYNITAVQAAAAPPYTEITISLITQVMPVLSMRLSPNLTEQLGNIEIFVNVTDRSGTGINFTEVNVTLPNGTVEIFNMSRTNATGNLSRWYFNYSGNMSAFNITGNLTNTTNYTGRTLLRGNYAVNATALDNADMTGKKGSVFRTYTKLVPTVYTGLSEYYPQQTGSIYYNLTDSANAALSGANVSFMLLGPSQNLLQKIPLSGTYTTGSDGMIWPIPTFSTNDYSAGTYNITANTTYFDTVLNATLNPINSKTFSVQSGSGGGGGGMDVKMETTVVWYPQNIISFDMWFTFNGNTTEPDNFTMSVQNAITRSTLFSITKNDTTEDAIGRYHYLYALGPNTPTGAYVAVITASKKGYVNNWIKDFRIASAGPYDLRLNLLQSEVERPGDLDFELTMVNNGEAGQDVNLQYWVTFENSTWDNRNEVYYTPAHTNSTITRSVHVYSDQPTGIAMLNVKMAYDTWQAPIIINSTFDVVEAITSIPPPPGTPAGGRGGGGGAITGGVITVPVVTMPPSGAGEAGAPGLGIANYPRQVNIVRGWTDIQSIEIRNNGDAALRNITLDITGIPPSWFNITPASVQYLPAGNITIFVLEFKVPKSAEAGEYGYTITAKSAGQTNEKVGKLTVFLSLPELIANDLKSLKIDLQKLEDDTDFAEKIGKNVRKVREAIDSVKSEISSAEENAKKGDYENALANTETALNLLKRGRSLLETAGAQKAMEKSLIPMWLVGILAVLLAIIAGGVVILIKSRKNISGMLPAVSREKVKGEKAGAAEKEELALEKEKIERMSKLLEQELKEGTVTQAVYDELKEHNDEKLAKIKKDVGS